MRIPTHTASSGGGGGTTTTSSASQGLNRKVCDLL